MLMAGGFQLVMGVPQKRWMVYNGKYDENGGFEGTHISGNHHIGSFNAWTFDFYGQNHGCVPDAAVLMADLRVSLFLNGKPKPCKRCPVL